MRSVYYISTLLLVVILQRLINMLKMSTYKDISWKRLENIQKPFNRGLLMPFMPNFSISLIVPFPCLLGIVKCLALDSFFFFLAVLCLPHCPFPGLSLIAGVGFSYSLEHTGSLVMAGRLLYNVRSYFPYQKLNLHPCSEKVDS